MSSPRPTPNPKRVAAGKRNRALRKGLTPDGVERLRQAALACRPWEMSTGPRTAAGKARAAANGLARAKGPESVRGAHREVAELRGLFARMAAAREMLTRGPAPRPPLPDAAREEPGDVAT